MVGGEEEATEVGATEEAERAVAGMGVAVKVEVEVEALGKVGVVMEEHLF